MESSSSGVGDGGWQDITADFMSSVKQLELGELLVCDNFTLLEAMSALELMDPKMDSGLMLLRCNRKIYSLEQSIRLGLVKINQLELVELVGIIDDTYSCLTHWLEGHTLAQTVMINLYLHDPDRIEDRCLKVFSQSMLKIVHSMDKLVQTVLCIEEEDFMSHMNKFNLASQVSDQKVLISIEELCQYYEKLLLDQTSSASNNHNNKRQNESQEETGTIQPQYEKHHLIAIINRLRFTYDLYACFFNISRNIIKDWKQEPQPAQFQKFSKLIQKSVSICDLHLEKCLKYLDKWMETIYVGIKPERTNGNDTNEGNYPSIMGFEPLINYKLLPPAYPRCPFIRSRPDTVDYLKNLTIRLRQCFSISSSFNQKSFKNSLDSIEYFSKYFRPSSCVISRSLMQILYQPNWFEYPLKDELAQSLNEFCEPLVQAIRKDETNSSLLDKFLIECSEAFWPVVHLYGHNAARQHEKFPDIIMSLKNLRYSALIINEKCNSSIVYSWITCQLARLCTKYVLSGLELEIYLPHEYPYVFWYLYDVLYRSEKEQLEIAKQSIYESQLILEHDSQKKGKNKKLRKKNQLNASVHDRSLLSIEAFRLLTGGTFLLTHGLKLQGKIKTPVMDYTSEAICFDHRFGAITHTSRYESYKRTLEKLDKLEYAYSEALDCFREAKESFESLGEHEDCLRVCKTNMIVAKILSTNPNSFSNRELEFCFDTHPSFPTVKV